MFIFLSQLFAFLSFLICLYILNVSLIHSIWEKVALYNRGFIVPQDGFVTKINFYVNIFSTNDSLTYFFYTYNILPKKNLKSCQNQSVCFTHAYRRVMRLPYISEECRLNDDSIYFHLNPFEEHEEWWFNIFPFESFWKAEI